MHGRRPLDENKCCRLCFQDRATVTTEKLYTRKELVMMETYIADLHTSLYKPGIQNLAFHLPHVRIISTNYCVNTRCESFKHCRAKQDVFCHCDYSERVVASSAHQI